MNTRLPAGVVQMRCIPGRVEQNLEHARDLVAEGARQGAKLLVLPEMFAQGYLARREVWAFAEPADGPTTRWLLETARRHQLYLGGGHVIADKRDVYNVFTLASPEGAVVGRVFKANAEASIFRRALAPHVIETPLGRIGIGICADNQFGTLLREYCEKGVVLMLMPHAWPIPVEPGGAVSLSDLRHGRDAVAMLPKIYARTAHAPALFANQVGPLVQMEGLLGRLMKPGQFGLPGLSRIVDRDSEKEAHLEAEEGVLVSPVTLGNGAPVPHEQIEPGWLLPGNAISRHVLVPLDVALGVGRYLMRHRPGTAIHRH